MLLLCILSFGNVSIGCDIVFQQGQILLTGFAFLLFRQFLDIYNQHELIPGCCFESERFF
jgi:hypothetical protein